MIDYIFLQTMMYNSYIIYYMVLLNIITYFIILEISEHEI